MLHSVRSDQRRCQGRSSISSRAWRPHHVSFPCQRHRYVELSKWRVVLACVGERVGRRSTESPETLLTLSINSRSETECQAHRSKRRAAMSGRRCHWRRRDNRDGLLSAGMCVCVCVSRRWQQKTPPATQQCPTYCDVNTCQLQPLESCDAVRPFQLTDWIFRREA